MFDVNTNVLKVSQIIATSRNCISFDKLDIGMIALNDNYQPPLFLYFHYCTTTVPQLCNYITTTVPCYLHFSNRWRLVRQFQGACTCQFLTTGWCTPTDSLLCASSVTSWSVLSYLYIVNYLLSYLYIP